MEAVRPDYTGACVNNLIRALQAREPWVPEDARDADSVVLLLLDGLGWNELRARRDQVPALGALAGHSITTVVPSTTPTALVSIATGLSPAEHGVVGYRMYLGKAILNVIRWTIHGGGKPPDPAEMQPREAFGGQAVPVVTRAQFKDTKFTQLQLRGAPFHGWITTSGLVEHARRLIAGGERLVYAYYDGLDVVAHVYGMRDEYFARELSFCDALVSDLLDALPEQCAVVVSADHGHVHFDERIELTEFGPLVAAQSGESRFRYLHARPGAAEELLSAATERYSTKSWVFSRERLLDEGWMGTRPASPDTRRRVGDVVLAARSPIGFVDPANPGESKLLTGHGSLTPDEMLVPLVAARGRR